MGLSFAIVCLLVLSAVVLYFLGVSLLLLFRQVISPLQELSGPPSTSFFMGNLPEMHDQENNDLVARWEARYGSTFIYHGFIGGCRLMTTDPVAVAHILGHAYDYPKPGFVRDDLASIAGGKQSLLTVEGDDHRRQRKILGPAFSSPHIRSLSHVFWEKAVQLRDIWLDVIDTTPSDYSTVLSRSSPPDPLMPQLSSSDGAQVYTTSFSCNPFAFVKSPSGTLKQQSSYLRQWHVDTTRPLSPALSYETTTPTTPPTIDVLTWLGRATLDVIGEAGFGYEFNSLSSAANSEVDDNELARAFGIIFATARKFRVLAILQVWFPILMRFRRNNTMEKQATATMRRIGLSLIEERRGEAVAERLAAGFLKTDPTRVEGVADVDNGGNASLGRDLLSVLVRSNMSSSPSQRLSLEEILCQISVFLAAGHETSSAALAWTLYALARAPDVQATLRTHLRGVALPADPPLPPAALAERIARLPYLDHVVREALRLHAPITNTMRVAAADGVIPVARPFRDRRGRERTEIRVRRGDIISVPIQAMNRSTAVWGEDAALFRPERWAADEAAGGPHRSAGAPGLWGNMLTFLNGNPVNGNRACIGYRFALSEIKMFLFVLVRDIEFSIDPSIEIEKKINVVTRPCVKSEPHMGNQMPLRMRRVPYTNGTST